jgi:two-component system, chemotaxis family, chemotaxis protein CheY
MLFSTRWEYMMRQKILIVDDSESVRQQLFEALSVAGFDILQAPNGSAGLDLVQANTDISLIFCDIHMPVMNGLSFLEAVSKLHRPSLSVLMLTAERAPDMIAQAKKLGAKGWLKKPFNVDMIVTTAHKLCPLRAA